MSYVFLILIFSNAPNPTINITTPMPNMEVCECMLDYHMDDLPNPKPNRGVGYIGKPMSGYCKEITVADKPEGK